MSIIRLHLTRDANNRITQKIALIKEIRAVSGLGLKEAKDAADELDERGTVTITASADANLTELQSVCQKEKITIQSGSKVGPKTELPPPPPKAEDNKIHLGISYKQPLIHKIELIKEIRTVTGLGLKEAKDAADELGSKFSIQLTAIDNADFAGLSAVCQKDKISLKLPILPKTPHPIAVATDTVPKVAPAAQKTYNQIIMLGFSGDILQEMELKTFLYTQFRINYSQAAEVVAQLQNGQQAKFDIKPAEQDFISAALDRYAVSYKFA